MRKGEKSKGRTFFPALMLFSPYVKKKVARIFCYFAGREGNPKIPSMDAIASELIISQKTKKKYCTAVYKAKTYSHFIVKPKNSTYIVRGVVI